MNNSRLNCFLRYRNRLFCALMLSVALAGKAGAADQVQPAEMSVQVLRTQVRQSPSAAAPVLATLTYKAQVTVLEIWGGWARVRVPGTGSVGYVYLSALSSRPLGTVGAEAPVPGVTRDEVTLAGKGFSEALEDSYKQSSKVDYAWVDFMESFEYRAESCVGFLEGEPGE